MLAFISYDPIVEIHLGPLAISPHGIGQAVHMPALYDFVSVGALLAGLLVLRRRARPTGFLIVVFAIWYGTARIVEDFFRVDVTHGTGLTGSQWVALATVVVAVVYLVRITRQSRNTAAPATTGPAARGSAG